MGRKTACDCNQRRSSITSQLRKALDPAEVIVTRAPGYLLRVGRDELDLFRASG